MPAEPIVATVTHAHRGRGPEPEHVFELLPILCCAVENRHSARHAGQLITRFTKGISRQDMDLQLGRDGDEPLPDAA